MIHVYEYRSTTAAKKATEEREYDYSQQLYMYKTQEPLFCVLRDTFIRKSHRQTNKQAGKLRSSYQVSYCCYFVLLVLYHLHLDSQ